MALGQASDYSLDLAGGIIIYPEPSSGRAMSFPFPWLMMPLIASSSSQLYMETVRLREGSEQLMDQGTKTRNSWSRNILRRIIRVSLPPLFDAK